MDGLEIFQRALGKEVNPVENALSTALKNSTDSIKSLPPIQILGAVGDFGNNFVGLLGDKSNSSTYDKYWHAKANAEASQIGPYGEWTAEKLSDFKEWFDQNALGHPKSASKEDQEANAYGRLKGRQYPNEDAGVLIKDVEKLFKP
jgi:hypothetical protein